MRKDNKIFLKVLFCLTLIMCLFSMDVYAVDATTFLKDTAIKATRIFRSTKGIIFVIGGFGLIGIGYKAIFGKLKWDWMAGLSLGLFVLAAVGAATEYITDGKGSWYGGGSASGDIFGTLSLRTITAARGLQQVAFAFGGFGVIMFTFLAICGKINFKHLGYIFICMFMLSGAGWIISYMTGGAADGNLGSLKGYAKPASFTSEGVGDSYERAASSL